MENFIEMNKEKLQQYEIELINRYESFKSQKLNYDMSRGNPCPEQLSLSNDLLTCIDDKEYKTANGVDCRNYCGALLDGIPEAKELFSKMIEVSESEIIIGGNSSLNMMYDTVARAMTHGVLGSDTPWCRLPAVKFLCPSPGYDRHFAICAFYNIEMITVDLKENGPDVDVIEDLVANDDSIKGIWCVPKYSNPAGITYSDNVVDRLAKMKTKAKDFRIFWDNAYTVHHLTDKHDKLKNILEACKEAGNPDRVFIYGSTSKVSFPGAGIAMMGASEANIKHIKKQMGVQTIGPDKINQLRHVKFFKTFENIENHMKKHAAILKPKFDIVLDIMENELGGKNIAWWNKPGGGYFISLNTMEGCAKKVVSMALQAGVKLTNAGATFPYGRDPKDRNIRIAPSFPSTDELRNAIGLLCVCIQLASVQKLLSEK